MKKSIFNTKSNKFKEGCFSDCLKPEETVKWFPAPVTELGISSAGSMVRATAFLSYRIAWMCIIKALFTWGWRKGLRRRQSHLSATFWALTRNISPNSNTWVFQSRINYYFYCNKIHFSSKKRTGYAQHFRKSLVLIFIET